MGTSDSQQATGQAYLSTWLPPSLRAAIEELAARHDRSLSGEVRQALRLHVVAEQHRGRASLGGSGWPGHDDAEGV